MTDTIAVLGEFITPGVAVATVDAFAILKEWLHPQNDHVTQTTPLSRWGVFTFGVGLAVIDPMPNLNSVTSSIREILKLV